MTDLSPPPVVHLDGYFDNPDGDFQIENEVLSSAGVRLCTPREDAWEQARKAMVVLTRAEKVDAGRIAQLECCKVLIRYGIGLDKIDLSAAAAAGIAVCNAPDFCIAELADHTMTLALMLARRIPDYQARARSGQWQLTHDVVIGGNSGLRLTTIGFGRIARQVLDRARAFGFRLSATDPMVPASLIREEGVEPLTLSAALRESDILCLHCPLTPETAGMIGHEALTSMKPGAIIINTARGGLIDLAALTTALRDGHLGGAGLDVTDPEPLPPGHPLYTMPQVVITPHMAWYSEQAEQKLRRSVAEEALRALRGEPLKNRVRTT